MADSPDVTPYVDLTLFDRGIQSIVATAFTDALTKLPGWVPREGNTEVVLLEAFAVEVSELVFAVNRVPGAVIEVLLRLFGLLPDLGAPASATVEFEAADSLGHEVPIGTRLRLVLGGGVEPVEFITTVGLVIPPGQTTGQVNAAATENGERAHGGQIGGALELLDALSFINTAELVTAPSGGRAPEDMTAFLDRGVTKLRGLVTTLVLPEHFALAALDRADVTRAQAIDNYNSAAGSGVPGDHPGHVTVAVAGPAAALLGAPAKAELEAALEAAALANLDVHITDPTVTAVNVTTTVKRLAGFTEAQVIANVTAVLDTYLSPDTWPWAATVRHNELIARIDSAAGVDYVVSLTVPAADQALTGAAPLANLGTLTVTVQAP